MSPLITPGRGVCHQQCVCPRKHRQTENQILEQGQFEGKWSEVKKQDNLAHNS